MAAYAAVVSLIHALGRIQDHTGLPSSYTQHAQRMWKISCFLYNFLETDSRRDVEEGRDLERQIADVAREAEETTENCVADYILRRSKFEYIPRHFDWLLEGVEEKMRFIEQKVKVVQGSSIPQRFLRRRFKSGRGLSGSQSSSDASAPNQRSGIVGLEDEKLQIMERLTGGQSSLQVVPISGMGGIGKTTLARSIYENPLIMHFFDTRIWFTISQECILLDLLLQIPICQKEQDDSEGLVAENRLGELLYKSLSQKRYLIIMDDMWNTDVWDEVKKFFPDNCNMSRIIVTTRLSNVAAYFSSCGVQMSFLDEEQSWKLFCEITFGQGDCPSDLEESGRKIVTKCQGLPLSITVIGGLLKQSSRTKGYFKSVAKDINSFLNLDEDEHCRSVLSLSYNHLSTHLKPCFLYMGVFPEDRDIKVSQLVKLWVAEGFLKPNEIYESWEDAAERYLKDLVDRNLILVRRWDLDGKIRTCYIHDLIRDLCLRVATQEGFLCLLRSNLDISLTECHERRVIFHDKHHSLSKSLHAFQLPLSFHTLVCHGGGLPQFSNKSLRILGGVHINSFEDVFLHVNLRFIQSHSTYVRKIPSSISHLWNLQTIICLNTFLVFAPREIWKMRQLRHVVFSEISLPDPPPIENISSYDPDLAHLQTLMKIVNFKLTKEALLRIQLIKKLQLKYEEFQGKGNTGAYYCLENLQHFSMIESLKVSFYVKESLKMDLQGCLKYPFYLKKLTLDNIQFSWKDVTKISFLPSLEELKLKGTIAGSSWNPVEGGFSSLKSMKIVAYIDLITWNADRSHFPVLKMIDLGSVPVLREIPSDIGEIPTLKVIGLHNCRAHTAISVMKILVDQQSYEVEDLRARVSFMNDEEESKFWEMARLDGLKNNNFIVENRN